MRSELHPPYQGPHSMCLQTPTGTLNSPHLNRALMWVLVVHRAFYGIIWPPKVSPHQKKATRPIKQGYRDPIIGLCGLVFGVLAFLLVLGTV